MKNHISFCVNNSKRLTFCFVNELQDVLRFLVMENFLTFHRARHSFRTIATKKGVRDGIAGRIMGHAEGNDIKDIYTHLHDEDIVKEVRDKWVV